jgi:hypothetical protein
VLLSPVKLFSRYNKHTFVIHPVIF